MKATHCFILNLFLAIIWIILNREAGVFQFLLGFGMGFFILFIFQRPLSTAAYVKRIKGFVKFIFVFIFLFISSNVNVAKVIIFYPKKDIVPSFISYPVDDLSHYESLLISQFITLTPGSVSVKLDESELIIHRLNVEDIDQVIANLDKLKYLILGFIR